LNARKIIKKSLEKRTAYISLINK